MTDISWDIGTAYDLFISLHVMHFPDQFGLRPTWAAGVRSRIPQPYRDFLEETMHYFHIPFGWISNLPEGQKSCEQALIALEHLETKALLRQLTLKTETPERIVSIFNKIVEHQTTSGSEIVTIRTHLKSLYENNRNETLNVVIGAWENAEQFRKNIIESIRAFYNVFFSSEIARIESNLNHVFSSSKDLLEVSSQEAVIENMTQGVNFSPYMNDPDHQLKKIKLVPSYWSSPLTFFEWLDEETLIIVFGCRKENDSIIPGEFIPNTLVKNLKTLADPTRLRILKSLTVKPSAPSQLASELRLRMPTVVHHLKQLRLAGMVKICLLPGGKKTYQIRPENISQLLTSLEEMFELER